MNQAIGMLEVQGYSVALAAMDKACKAANITIQGIDCNNPSTGDAAPIPVVIQVKFTGSISDVKVALEVAKQEASRFIAENDIFTHFISSASTDLEKLICLSKVRQKS